MGVPAFYRWLSEKYPKIVQDVLEERVNVCNINGNGAVTPLLPMDWTGPNPAGLECDNLYIDMNGIIHPCSHPEQGPQPQTEEEMYENVCQYVDRLVRAIRPRKLLYLAIDGVAPRAKMNQQRSRRFRAAQEARELAALESHVRQELVGSGQQVPEIKKAAWDSNVITPGTPFMLRLADFVRFYIRKRISQDKSWKNLRVIFSDASIPGEGEHKIMAHVRLQRAQPGYNPNTVHVLHGLDADLIMLALATHEAHFYISREEVLFGRKSQEMKEQRQLESGFLDAQKQLDEKVGPDAMSLLINQNKPLQRISIPILREYLAVEFAQLLYPRSLPFPPSLERLIDDFVFMCFFVGNDFLPHLPSLDIRDGALDFLLNCYKRLLPSMGGYIAESGGKVNLSRVDIILAEVGAIEDYVFQMKFEGERREKQRRADLRKNTKRGDAPPLAVPNVTHQVRGRAAKILEQQREQTVPLQRGHLAKEHARQGAKAKHMHQQDNLDVAASLKAELTGLKNDLSKTTVSGHENDDVDDDHGDINTDESKEEEAIEMGTNDESMIISNLKQDPEHSVECHEKKPSAKSEFGKFEEAEDGFYADEHDVVDEMDDDEEDIDKRIEEAIVSTDPQVASMFKEKIKAAQQEQLDQHANTVVDNVRLHEAGWKDRYYSDKCKADDINQHGGREHLFRSYVVGLCWVMKYYYDGCPSWKWYYPYHYGPFASDLRNIERFETAVRSLELSSPFNPVEQLMAVLPADSRHAIPRAAQWLMIDPESPIIDFYPTDVPVDPNGKALPWLWVVLLPFIEEDRLLAAMSPTMVQWTKEELMCNARGLDDGYLFIHRSNPLSKKLATVLRDGKVTKTTKSKLTDAAAYGCHGFSGSVRPPLSNELYLVEEDATIPPPASAGKIDRVSDDNVFADAIFVNEAVCVSFTEPNKLPHKSVLLPGSRLVAPNLTDDDKRLRRPRLNRFGGTIANLGTSDGKSFQPGFGSMNMGSYERELAGRTNREAQMYQPGVRAWGAMEPMPKRFRHEPDPPLRLQATQIHPNFSSGRPQWQHQMASNAHIRFDANMPAIPQHYNQYHNQNRPSYTPPVPPQPQQQFDQHGGSLGNRYQQPGPFHGGNVHPQHHGHPHPRQQTYSFRKQENYNNRSSQPPQQSRPVADVMSNLRAQLTSTLKRNRQDTQGNHR